jgi:hypothetical protein
MVGDNMRLVKKYVTNNIHYKNNKIINIKGLVLHSVGCPQPDPNVFINNWDTSSNRYLTQIIIGKGVAYEVLPCTNIKGKAVYCWHVGNANGYTIGAEMTEPSTIKYTTGSNWVDLDPVKTKAHVMATYKNAVDISAQLCKFHGLNPLADGVILSHSECHRRGIGTNHGDVEHIWKKFGLTMDKFREDVNVAMNNIPFMVKVSIDDLNMRVGPGTNYQRIGFIPKGVYTITKLKGNWGRLKSKQLFGGKYVDTWIHIGYTTKV